MVKVKLITSYLDNSAGSIYETDRKKAEQLVALGRAKWLRKPRAKIMKPRKRGHYYTK